jgi:hypothetical protein
MEVSQLLMVVVAVAVICKIYWEDAHSLGLKHRATSEKGVGFWIASGRWPDGAPVNTTTTRGKCGIVLHDPSHRNSQHRIRSGYRE